MRLSLPLLVPALACLVQADSGKLYIYDSQLQAASSDSTTTATINPETARLIIASRLGLDQYHDLGSASEDTIKAINDLSSSQHLFTAPNEASSVALVLGHAVSEKHELVNSASRHVQTVQINDVPSIASTEKLVLDLASQSGMSTSDRKAARLAELRDDLFASPAGPLFRIAKDEADLKLVIDTLLRQDYTVLALTVPNDTTSKHTFGKYSTDLKHSSLNKRQYQEAPLITGPSPVAAPKLKPTSSPRVGNNSLPLRGILPQCFSSLSACQALTRNCTGHGACRLKYTDRDSRPEAACYSCSCAATVVTNKDGSHKTTRWGGPACQKKDVVMPFWLLAGFSVLMAGLVSWGIGMLLTMGNEELPSVIGAGVSGVPRSK